MGTRRSTWCAAKMKKVGEPCTLYCKGRILGYKRSKANQYENTSLIKIENVVQPSFTLASGLLTSTKRKKRSMAASSASYGAKYVGRMVTTASCDASSARICHRALLQALAA